MKTRYLLLVCVLLLLSLLSKGQTRETLSNNSNERAATGQTKWMLHNLKFDSLQYTIIYNINLKYQLRSDMVHKVQNITTTERRRLYLEIAKDKKDELKVVLDPVIYDRYLTLLQTIKQKQP